MPLKKQEDPGSWKNARSEELTLEEDRYDRLCSGGGGGGESGVSHTVEVILGHCPRGMELTPGAFEQKIIRRMSGPVLENKVDNQL